jgi:LPXTG-motif cell wall-anchored protein
LFYKFGDLFTQFMKKNGSKWFTVIGILIVLILGIMYFFQKFNA